MFFPQHLVYSLEFQRLLHFLLEFSIDILNGGLQYNFFWKSPILYFIFLFSLTDDFSLTLKKAADFVLGDAVREGNISLTQRAAIERKLTTLLEGKFKNKTQGIFILYFVFFDA